MLLMRKYLQQVRRKKEALENYKNALSGSGDSFRPTSNGKEAQKEGVVQRVYKEKIR